MAIPSVSISGRKSTSGWLSMVKTGRAMLIWIGSAAIRRARFMTSG
jgi:hypothetical protein